MKSKQQGSAHIVIIGILVAVIIAALGFIFWQNFMKEKPTSTNTQTTNTTTKTDTAATAPRGLVFSAWNITVPVTRTDFKIDNNAPGNSIEHYTITTQSITDEAAKISGCNDIDLGSIQRVSSFEAGDPTPHSEKIGNYYYGFVPRSQAACVDDNGNAPETLNSLMTDAIRDLKAAIVQTTAS